MQEIPIGELLEAAREGARHAFLTKPGGTRYGAAVWTTSARMHRCGQYSSFNHSTNIHAEMGALAIAAAAGDADVRALALVSTSCRDVPARPCGVCRQVILEHARRTGAPIVVVMASWDGRVIEQMTSDELLPWAWEAKSAARTNAWIAADPPSKAPLQCGDQVEVQDGALGTVLHPSWLDARAWVMLTHVEGRTLACAQNAWSANQRELSQLGIGEATSWGDRFVLMDPARAPRLPLQPLSLIGLPRVRALVDALVLTGVKSADIRVSGLHAAGFAQLDSDIELVISALPAQIDAARRTITESMMQTNDEPIARVRVHWTSALSPALPHTKDLLRGGYMLARGRVVSIVSHANPTQWLFATDDGHHLNIESWHAGATALHENDRVEIAAIKLEGDARWFQFSSERDFIRMTEAAHA